MGKNKHAVVYPISSGRYINVVAAVHNLSEEGKPWECGRPWNTDVTQGEFLSQFEGWEEEFQALMKVSVEDSN
jgi:salicylate hydroxylase